VIESTPNGIVVNIRVVPRAAKSGPAGTREGALLVRLNAPPVDGAANEELVRVIADVLGVSTRAVTIVGGSRSRTKRVHVTGITEVTARSRLMPV
jgi:uncharacterized protein (TIGR00251 family)